MPSITINSKGTTIRLTRAEVRAMQSTYATLQAVAEHHPISDARTTADETVAHLDGILKLLGEKTAETK